MCIRDRVVCGTKNWMLRITASHIAAPPSIAVGALCQRSVLGFATNPKRRAKVCTSGVRTSASRNELATGRSVRRLKDIFHQGQGINYQSNQSLADADR